MSSLKKNFSYLFLGQLFNQFLPLLVIPYLTKVLSIEYYGVYAYTVAWIAIISILLDFGFNIFGVERIVKTRYINKRLKTVYSGVVSAKILMLVLSIIIYLFYIFLSNDYSGNKLQMFWGVISIFAIAFQPFWIFTGLEKNYLIMICALIGKLLFLFLVFLFIKNNDDLGYLIFYYGLSQVLTTIIGVYFLRKNNIHILRIDFRKGVSYIKRAWPFFISRLAVAMYSTGAGVFLGAFSNAASVAVYSIAEQMYKGVQALISPISQVMYPYMMRTKNFLLLYKITGAAITLTVFCSVFGYFSAPYFVDYFFGSKYLDSIKVFNVFLITIIFVVPSVLFGYPLLGARGRLHQANSSVIYAGVVQIICFLFIALFGLISPISVALSVLLAESYVLFLRFKWGIWNERNSNEKSIY